MDTSSAAGKTNIKRRALSALDIPSGILSGDVHIEMNGSRELYIDGCQSVALYENGIITLNSHNSRITVSGNNLTLCSLSSDQLKIEGSIRSVNFE